MHCAFAQFLRCRVVRNLEVSDGTGIGLGCGTSVENKCSAADPTTPNVKRGNGGNTAITEATLPNLFSHGAMARSAGGYKARQRLERTLRHHF